MEIGPILRSLMHNKARFWLIALEVALTLAIVANCVNWMLDMRRDFLRDTGYDEEHVMIVRTEPWAPEFKDEEFVHSVRESDLDRLSSFPGVRAATAIHHTPLSGGGSSSGRKAAGSELDTISTPYYVVSADALDAFGVELAAGRNFAPGDFEEQLANQDLPDDQPRHYNVLLSQAMADDLFPDGDGLGNQIESSNGERVNTVIGIIKEIHNSWPSWEHYDRVMLIPGRPGSANRMLYAVRAEPGAVDAVYTGLEELMLELNSGRIVSVRTLSEIKNETYQVTHAMVKMLSWVIGFLILVTSLGIVGLTSSAVTQRIRQIGTRRALGATKVDIVRYFLVENWVITGFGLVFGIGMTYALNYLLVQWAEVPKMDLGLMIGGVALMWATGVLAALAPAIRATSIAPEVATRSV